MFEIKPITLIGKHVQLEPLCENHRNDLYLTAQIDEIISAHMPTKIYGNSFHRWFDSALNKMHTQEQLPFVVRRLADQQILGSSRYYDINLEHRRLTLGYTWYIPAVWSTSVNPECKYLLLQNAFENLLVNRVEFKIDARNARSCAAVKKLGAVEEGILRKHIILEDGFVRDTVVFSIIQSEWPAVKTQLIQRL